jgi:hypothetical protein
MPENMRDVMLHWLMETAEADTFTRLLATQCPSGPFTGLDEPDAIGRE